MKPGLGDSPLPSVCLHLLHTVAVLPKYHRLLCQRRCSVSHRRINKAEGISSKTAGQAGMPILGHWHVEPSSHPKFTHVVNAQQSARETVWWVSGLTGPEHLSLIHWTHSGECQSLSVVFWPPRTHTGTQCTPHPLLWNKYSECLEIFKYRPGIAVQVFDSSTQKTELSGSESFLIYIPSSRSDRVTQWKSVSKTN